MVRERFALSVTLAVVWAASSCQGPPEESPSFHTSSSDDEGMATSSGDPTPDRVPPEPFVLPPGCGDGIPVSGQYDCHYLVSLGYLKEAMGSKQAPTKFMAWDMDGDSRDELLAQASGFDPTPKLLAPLRWDGERFDVGRPAGAQLSLQDWTTHFDLDGDGLRDLVKMDNGLLSYHLMTPDLGLEDERIPALFDVAIWGFTGPMDVDADGQLEALTVRYPFTDEDFHPPLELWLHRDVEGVWVPTGQALELPGCQWAARFAWADFDGDGQEDVAVLNHPSACDPFVLDYDPSWHSISIFFTEPITHTLIPGPVIPAGGVTYDELLMLEDFDGDGALDFLVGLGEPVNQTMTGAALVRGHGDGSFDEGVPITLPGLAEWSIVGRGDLDGDGDLDWILRGDTVVDDIFADEPGLAHVRSDVIGIDGEPWANTRAFGDFNGDGVVDYVGGKQAADGEAEMVAMISDP